MKFVEDAALLQFKRNSPTFDFPNAFARYIKSMGDIYYSNKAKFHVITKVTDAKEILTNPIYSADRGSFFISRMPEMDLSLITDFFSVVKKMMVMSDDKEHAQRRKIAFQGFEESIRDRFTSKVKSSVIDLVENIKNKKTFNFVDEISHQLPSIVLADLFNLPQADRKEFFLYSNQMTAFFGGATSYKNEDGIRVNHAAKTLKNYFEGLIKERRKNYGEDYVSLLLKAQENTTLSDEDLISQMIMMFVAGQATTTDQMNNIMYLFSCFPELQSEVKQNPKLLTSALEELKRFDPAVTFIFRVAREDGQLGSQPIRKGDTLFISTHCINRDLPESELPYEIKLDRKATHFAYGYGNHYCFGARLSRMEIHFLFEEIFRELPILKLSRNFESKRDHYSLAFSGFEKLFLEQ